MPTRSSNQPKFKRSSTTSNGGRDPEHVCPDELPGTRKGNRRLREIAQRAEREEQSGTSDATLSEDYLNLFDQYADESVDTAHRALAAVLSVLGASANPDFAGAILLTEVDQVAADSLDERFDKVRSVACMYDGGLMLWCRVSTFR
jgi:hypothetical protein